VQKQMKILIACRNVSALTAIGESITNPRFDIEHRHISNGHTDPLHGVPDLPDLLIFGMDESNEDELKCLVERPAELRPAILVIGPAGNTKFMRLAMQAGACDYLEDPVSETDLRETVESVWKNLSSQMVNDEGKLTAVVSAKGGSGASFLAVNIAHMMATSSEYRTALLDLDLQFASLGQYLDIKVEQGLMRALDMAENLDAVAMDACMAKHPSGVTLLGPLPEEIILSRDIPVVRFNRLLDLMKENYDHVVVDQPRMIDDISAAVYEHADQVLLVTQQELANVRDAGRLRQILLHELAFSEDRITVIVNRYMKNLPVELDDICKSLGVDKQDVVLVPNHYRDVAESMNIGIPMLDHARGSSVTKALMGLKNQLVGGAEGSTGSTRLSKVISSLMGG